jgi:hypothetical protein
MDTRGRTLCLITTLVCFVNGTASWGQQTYNPTASDNSRNTAGGTGALPSNSGGRNTGFGFNALGSNTTGYFNTATGHEALGSNTTGLENTATGDEALLNNTTGSNTTALGYTALLAGTGSCNTALGWGAGSSLDSGDDNIYLGHPGAASESQTMRLGTPSLQTRAFMAGIADVPVHGSHVVITSSGQLGVVGSSARYKRDVEDMRERSAGVHKLRPVTFRYKTDEE